MAPRVVLWVYLTVAVVNVGAVLASARPVEIATKVALMPLLAAWIVADGRGRAFAWPGPLRWLVAGLGFAWLGDVLLLGDGDLWFVGGLAAFAVMQVCYLVAIRRIPGPGLVRAWPITIVPYALVWVGVNAAVGAGVGDLRIPVLAYSALLVVVALAALDLVLRVPRRLGWRIAGGAAAFVVSDGLIALGAFGPLPDGPIAGALVMATYSAAQVLIATGFTGSVRA